MEHYYQNIQNWFDYQDVFKLAVKKAKDGAKFVEIGVWRGGSTAFMGVEILNSGKSIQYHAIDTFDGSKEHVVYGDSLYFEALNNLKPLIDLNIVNVIRNHSLNAAKNYEDGTLDFVFIDGSHEYEDVKADINAYLPKVKDGGILAGHDYNDYWIGVTNAVNETLDKDLVIRVGNSWVYYKN